MAVNGMDGLMKIKAQPDRTLPEGYNVRVHVVCYYVSMLHNDRRYSLLNKIGEPKRFRIQDKAYEYARQHASLGLTFDQEVPDWR